MKNFLKQFLSFWKKTYSKPIRIIFLLVFWGGIFIICREAFYFEQIEDAGFFFTFLIVLIVLVLIPPILRTLAFYSKKLTLPMTTFQKCLIGLIFCILITLIFILIKVF